MAVSASADRPGLRELKWIHPDTDPRVTITAMTRAPAECLTLPSDPEKARSLRLGRVAFRTPVLLGGVAARIGLSCDHCHRNGHGNPNFFIAGVSGDPGTADVTGSVFSTHRDDRRSNPVPIPSLLDVATHPPFGTVLPAPDLPTFLHAAIVDEFMGQPPPPAVLNGLDAYLRALSSSACPSPAVTAITFDADAHELLETLDVVIEAVEENDLAVSEFALLALRSALGRVHERFPEAVAERDRLVESSLSLSQIQSRLGSGSKAELVQMLSAERVRLMDVVSALRMKADQSFYEPDVLRRAFELTR